MEGSQYVPKNSACPECARHNHNQHHSSVLPLQIVTVAEYTHIIILLFGLFVTGLLDILVPSIAVRILSFIISGMGIGSLILLGKGMEERSALMLLPYIFWRLVVTGLLGTGLEKV